MGVLNGIITLIALLTFIGIVWWAFSKFRAKDNEEASLLPFAQPDESVAETEQEVEAEEKKQEGDRNE
ncbi:CcoQ/FixQ family Cbb3-type cytochrome c oxidase assembly chaperone [Pusillimonas sp. CC-YST705]|uniref:CcoQ/FixQ family Cbb3-type cytochrome c oxidase assembly chaperone n=1 Tax=Mesopusillimonas faecipullorum TaxID=2755040 RepID=A0ABS8CBQ4_9BURK|nr:CcoQ/FixQ family Cbb3-type cytochrome c oxidase assembly chaperone [Mesopusillimonas faecipullorum]MCB5363289.1 CcoQ/FixQ family Cbb3-type cytochrome c oxidase assembly chaperone [Mesopusillimonas faecipullorum]